MNNWRDHAACQGADDGLFFPGTTGKANAAKALRICRTCEVRAECLQHALTAVEQYGVWGGKTEQELREMRKMRKRPPVCGTEAGYRNHFRRGEKPCGACIEGAGTERRLRYAAQQASR